MKRAATLAALMMLAAPVLALAAEPSGCDKFAWDIGPEQALLNGPTRSAGDTPLDRSTVAVQVALVPFAEAALPMPPERAPKDANSFAGAVSFAAGNAATYRIAISAAAWLDVIQGGAYVKSGKFTGATDCAGIRKTVEFAIGASPFIVQISGADSSDLRMVLTPSP
jgi:hypothetical protein